MQAALESRKITATSTESEYVAQTLTELPDDQADDVMKLVAKGRSKDLQQLVPELPRELTQVVKDGMALKPKDRIQSAEELAERLRPFVSAAHFAFASACVALPSVRA